MDLAGRKILSWRDMSNANIRPKAIMHIAITCCQPPFILATKAYHVLTNIEYNFPPK